MFEKSRGLFLTGPAGCGKTALLKSLNRLMKKGDKSNWIYCKERDDIEYLRSRDAEWLNDTLWLDDIGVEEVVKEYGNTIDVIGDAIQMYHYRGRGRLMVSTNLNSQGLNEKYGTRTLDRILEKCVVLKFNGKSKRERIVI